MVPDGVGTVLAHGAVAVDAYMLLLGAKFFTSITRRQPTVGEARLPMPKGMAYKD
jgi:hypothetical protein